MMKGFSLNFCNNLSFLLSFFRLDLDLVLDLNVFADTPERSSHVFSIDFEIYQIG